MTPIALVGEPTRRRELRAAGRRRWIAPARELGIDYIGGFSALVEKGMTPGDAVLHRLDPRGARRDRSACARRSTWRPRAPASTWTRSRTMGHVIKALAERTADRGGIGCAKLVIFANMPEDNPFVAGAMHGVGEGDCVLNVGVSGPGVVLSALRRLRESGGRVEPRPTSPRPSSAWRSRSRAPAS